MSHKLLHLTLAISGRKVCFHADHIAGVQELGSQSIIVVSGPERAAHNVSESYETVIRLWGTALSNQS